MRLPVNSPRTTLATTLAWLLAEKPDFRHRALLCGITQNKDVFVHGGAHIRWRDRGPARIIGQASQLCDLARFLSGDHVANVDLFGLPINHDFHRIGGRTSTFAPPKSGPIRVTIPP